MVCCATNKATLDLVDYINQGILMIAEPEIKSLERYASVTGKNYRTDQKLSEALTNYVIPNYKRFLDLLRTINPRTQEIKRVHAIYVRGAEFLYRGFQILLIGVDKNDENIVMLANEKIVKGRLEVERWKNEIMVLYKKYGVVVKNSEKPKKKS
jgi:hypothetical protein